jgi:hypothetical protein
VKRAGQKSTRRTTAKRPRQREKFSKNKNRTRQGLGEKQLPFFPFRLGAADSSEQGKERHEIERDLEVEESSRIRVLAENCGRNSTEQASAQKTCR